MKNKESLHSLTASSGEVPKGKKSHLITSQKC